MRPLLGRFHLPATCRLGWGAAEGVGRDIRRLAPEARSVLLVTAASMRAGPIVRAVREKLEAEDLRVALAAEATHVPDQSHVAEGLAAYREGSCAALVSVGGGNAHDLAKAIGVVAVHGGAFADREADRIRAPNPPHVAVNTTAGTGSELSRHVFILSHRRGRRLQVSDRRITPRVAINDPQTHMSLPPPLTASGGLNVLTHAAGALLSPSAMRLTDALALDAIALVGRYLERAVDNGGDEEARTAMAQAEQMAGIAYNGAGLGLADAVSLTLTGVYDVPHGECNAILLPYVLAFNAPVRRDRVADVGRALGAPGSGRSAAEFAIQATRGLARRVGLRGSLREMGIDEDVVYTTLWSILQSPLLVHNPRPVTEDAIEELLLESVAGEPPGDTLATLPGRASGSAQ